MSVVIHILAHLFTAIAAICVCVFLGLTTSSTNIVEVDSDLLLQRFSESQSSLSDTQFSRNVQSYLVAMDLVLTGLAEDRNVVVVDADLAIAGAQDVTDEAYRLALSLMELGLGAS